MKPILLVSLVCAVGLVWGTSVAAKDKPGKDPGKKANATQGAQEETQAPKGHGKPDGRNQAGKSAQELSPEERSTIQAYVRGFDTPKKLPPGLAKKAARGRGLPPGWQKKLVPGEIMPAPVLEQCHPLPPELVVKLPPSPAGTMTVAIGGKVARVVQATREILDIFDVHIGL